MEKVGFNVKKWGCEKRTQIWRKSAFFGGNAQKFPKSLLRFLRFCAANFALGRPRFVPPDLETHLISGETLYEMRFLSIKWRIELIRHEHGLSLSK